jgi:cytochrome c biogenesis protein CcdA
MYRMQVYDGQTTGMHWQRQKVAAEHLRDRLRAAQVDNALLTRLAPFTGGYGLSFVIAGVNALWLTRITLKERRYTRTALTAVGVAIILLYVVFLRHLQHSAREGTSAVATRALPFIAAPLNSFEYRAGRSESLCY